MDTVKSEHMFLGMPWHPDRCRTSTDRCEACGRPKNLYVRTLSASMAATLVALFRLQVKNDGRKYFHVREFDRGSGRGEVGKLRYWGLVEEMSNTDRDKKHSGYWLITELGISFVSDLTVTVPTSVVIDYGNRHTGFCGPAVTIRHCLERKNRFSYEQLMNG